jgi:hypothetical protein
MNLNSNYILPDGTILINPVWSIYLVHEGKIYIKLTAERVENSQTEGNEFAFYACDVQEGVPAEQSVLSLPEFANSTPAEPEP